MVFPTLWSVLAICAVVFATLINEVVPGYWMPDVGEETLNGMLKVIASTMLSISTFSLSILYSAFTFASSNATPRATELIIGDNRAHEAISSFIATFIFSQVASIAMGMDYYGPSGRVVLLLETIGVLALVILALLCWLETLSRFGRVAYIIDQVETVAHEAFRHYLEDPNPGRP